ncbi:hypothetical protein AALA22_11665 [Anaerovoracaceae bacterium 41-7]
MDKIAQQSKADEAAEAIIEGKEKLYKDNFLPITELVEEDEADN